MDIVKWNYAEDAWLEVGDTSLLSNLWNSSFYNSQKENGLKAGISELAVLSNIDYMYYAVRFFCGIELLPIQAALLDEITRRAFPMLLMSRGGGKTFMLAIHSIMKALFNPEHKVVIAGAGFRQSKQVFENVEKIWNGSPMLRSVCTRNSGPRHDNDRWTFYLNDSTIVAVPVGCLAEDTLITTDRGITTIKNAWVDGAQNCRVWDGEKFTPIGFHHYNGIKPTIKVRTKEGFEYVGTYDHKMKVLRDNTVVWVESQNIKIGDEILIDLSKRWHDYTELTSSEKTNAFSDGFYFNQEKDLLHTFSLPYGYAYNFLSGLLLKRNKHGVVDCSDLSEETTKRLHLFFAHFGILATRSENTLTISTKKHYGLVFDEVVLVEEHVAIPTYDIHVPEHNTYIANGFVSHNTGDKIRGLRAHTIVADEFASHNPDIYETVIAPFSAVESQPSKGVQKTRMRDILIEQGLWNEDSENAFGVKTENQSILTGTASYSFNHFYDYYKRYKGIIESKGNEEKLLEVLGGEVPENFNWKDYSIIRIPFSQMPKGFMSEKNISRAKATIHSTIYKMEYECCFCDDSDGFFKRSLIESCVAKEKNIAKSDWPSWCQFPFEATTRGDLNKKYVYGIDPAFEVDNFSISVLELNDNHSRLVYAWTINKAKFLESIKLGITKENDYYQFCARKIRDLMKVFPAMAIGIDAQGGGTTIEQALRDKTKLEENEVPLWPVIEDGKKKETDSMAGLHILHMIQFANPTWTSEANYGLLQDLQGKMILFPHFDQISLEIASGQDLMREKEYKEKFGKSLTIFDSLEDCVLEIEETKEELSTIRVTRTGSGVNSRERWSTPETKLSGNRKGYLRKDRYSSLLIANYLAKLFRNKLPQVRYESHGGFVRNFKPKNNIMYSGPDWVTRKTNK